MESAYRWSPEVEQQFLSLMAVGCSAAIVAEQIGCAERTARTLIRRYRIGLPLNCAPTRHPAKVALTPGKIANPPGRPAGKWAEQYEAMSEAERERRRCGALQRIIAGRSPEFAASAVKVPRAIVDRWIEEWDGGPLDAPDHIEVPQKMPEWPAWARFEDDPRACRPEPQWRPSAHLSDHRSLCSTAMAWMGR